MISSATDHCCLCVGGVGVSGGVELFSVVERVHSSSDSRHRYSATASSDCCQLLPQRHVQRHVGTITQRHDVVKSARRHDRRHRGH